MSGATAVDHEMPSDLWGCIRDGKSPLSWLMLSYNGKDPGTMAAHARGVTGLADFVSHLDDGLVLFCGLRCRAVDERGTVRSVRNKFVFVAWIGADVKPMARAKVSAHKGAFEALFAGTQLSVQTSDRRDLEAKELEARLQASTSAHKPTGYDFSGGLMDGDREQEQAEFAEAEAAVSAAALTDAEKNAAKDSATKPQPQPPPRQHSTAPPPPVETPPPRAAEAKRQSTASSGREGSAEAMWTTIRDGKSPLSWLAVSYDGKDPASLAVHAKGATGLADFASHLDDSLVLFCGLRCRAVDERGTVRSVRNKFVFVAWIGADVKPMARAKVSAHKGAFEALFAGTQLSVQTSDRRDLEAKELEARLQASTSAHKPTGYDFSGGVGCRPTSASRNTRAAAAGHSGAAAPAQDATGTAGAEQSSGPPPPPVAAATAAEPAAVADDAAGLGGDKEAAEAAAAGCARGSAAAEEEEEEGEEGVRADNDEETRELAAAAVAEGGGEGAAEAEEATAAAAAHTACPKNEEEQPGEEAALKASEAEPEAPADVAAAAAATAADADAPEASSAERAVPARAEPTPTTQGETVEAEADAASPAVVETEQEGAAQEAAAAEAAAASSAEGGGQASEEQAAAAAPQQQQELAETQATQGEGPAREAEEAAEAAAVAAAADDDTAPKEEGGAQGADPAAPSAVKDEAAETDGAAATPDAAASVPTTAEVPAGDEGDGQATAAATDSTAEETPLTTGEASSETVAVTPADTSAEPGEGAAEAPAAPSTDAQQAEAEAGQVAGEEAAALADAEDADDHVRDTDKDEDVVAKGDDAEAPDAPEAAGSCAPPADTGAPEEAPAPAPAETEAKPEDAAAAESGVSAEAAAAAATGAASSEEAPPTASEPATQLQKDEAAAAADADAAVATEESHLTPTAPAGTTAAAAAAPEPSSEDALVPAAASSDAVLSPPPDSSVHEKVAADAAAPDKVAAAAETKALAPAPAPAAVKAEETAVPPTEGDGDRDAAGTDTDAATKEKLRSEEATAAATSPPPPKDAEGGGEGEGGGSVRKTSFADDGAGPFKPCRVSERPERRQERTLPPVCLGAEAAVALAAAQPSPQAQLESLRILSRAFSDADADAAAPDAPTPPSAPPPTQWAAGEALGLLCELAKDGTPALAHVAAAAAAPTPQQLAAPEAKPLAAAKAATPPPPQPAAAAPNAEGAASEAFEFVASCEPSALALQHVLMARKECRVGPVVFNLPPPDTVASPCTSQLSLSDGSRSHEVFPLLQLLPTMQQQQQQQQQPPPGVDMRPGEAMRIFCDLRHNNTLLLMLHDLLDEDANPQRARNTWPPPCDPVWPTPTPTSPPPPAAATTTTTAQRDIELDYLHRELEAQRARTATLEARAQRAEEAAARAAARCEAEHAGRERAEAARGEAEAHVAALEEAAAARARRQADEGRAARAGAEELQRTREECRALERRHEEGCAEGEARAREAAGVARRLASLESGADDVGAAAAAALLRVLVEDEAAARRAAAAEECETRARTQREVDELTAECLGAMLEAARPPPPPKAAVSPAAETAAAAVEAEEKVEEEEEEALLYKGDVEAYLTIEGSYTVYPVTLPWSCTYGRLREVLRAHPVLQKLPAEQVSFFKGGPRGSGGGGGGGSGKAAPCEAATRVRFPFVPVNVDAGVLDERLSTHYAASVRCTLEGNDDQWRQRRRTMRRTRGRKWGGGGGGGGGCAPSSPLPAHGATVPVITLFLRERPTELWNGRGRCPFDFFPAGADSLGSGCLHYACAADDVASVKKLLEHGCAPAQVDSRGWNAAHVAARNGRHRVLSALLAAAPGVQKGQDLQGRSALHLAVTHGHMLCVDVLVRAGCNAALLDAHGRGPLHCAIARGSPAFVEKLLRAGAPVTFDAHSDAAVRRCRVRGGAEHAVLSFSCEPLVECVSQLPDAAAASTFAALAASPAAVAAAKAGGGSVRVAVDALCGFARLQEVRCGGASLVPSTGCMARGFDAAAPPGSGSRLVGVRTAVVSAVHCRKPRFLRALVDSLVGAAEGTGGGVGPQLLEGWVGVSCADAAPLAEYAASLGDLELLKQCLRLAGTEALLPATGLAARLLQHALVAAAPAAAAAAAVAANDVVEFLLREFYTPPPPSAAAAEAALRPHVSCVTVFASVWGCVRGSALRRAMGGGGGASATFVTPLGAALLARRGGGREAAARRLLACGKEWGAAASEPCVELFGSAKAGYYYATPLYVAVDAGDAALAALLLDAGANPNAGVVHTPTREGAGRARAKHTRVASCLSAAFPAVSARDAGRRLALPRVAASHDEASKMRCLAMLLRPRGGGGGVDDGDLAAAALEAAAAAVAPLEPALCAAAFELRCGDGDGDGDGLHAVSRVRRSLLLRAVRARGCPADVRGEVLTLLCRRLPFVQEFNALADAEKVEVCVALDAVGGVNLACGYAARAPPGPKMRHKSAVDGGGSSGGGSLGGGSPGGGTLLSPIERRQKRSSTAAHHPSWTRLLELVSLRGVEAPAEQLANGLLVCLADTGAQAEMKAFCGAAEAGGGTAAVAIGYPAVLATLLRRGRVLACAEVASFAAAVPARRAALRSSAVFVDAVAACRSNILPEAVKAVFAEWAAEAPAGPAAAVLARAAALGSRGVVAHVARLLGRAALEARDGDGHTALHVACARGCLPVVAALLAELPEAAGMRDDALMQAALAPLPDFLRGPVAVAGRRARREPPLCAEAVRLRRVARDAWRGRSELIGLLPLQYLTPLARRRLEQHYRAGPARAAGAAAGEAAALAQEAPVVFGSPLCDALFMHPGDWTGQPPREFAVGGGAGAGGGGGVPRVCVSDEELSKVALGRPVEGASVAGGVGGGAGGGGGAAASAMPATEDLAARYAATVSKPNKALLKLLVSFRFFLKCINTHCSPRLFLPPPSPGRRRRPPGIPGSQPELHRPENHHVRANHVGRHAASREPQPAQLPGDERGCGPAVPRCGTAPDPALHRPVGQPRSVPRRRHQAAQAEAGQSQDRSHRSGGDGAVDEHDSCM